MMDSGTTMSILCRSFIASWRGEDDTQRWARHCWRNEVKYTRVHC